MVRLRNTSSKPVIKHLKEIFCRHCIPQNVMSDNRPQFTIQLYKQLANQFGFNRLYSSPIFPRSNGKAERTVQAIKQLITKVKADNTDINIVLLAYRNTKLYDMKASPAKLLMSRNLRSRIPTTQNNFEAKSHTIQNTTHQDSTT